MVKPKRNTIAITGRTDIAGHILNVLKKVAVWDKPVPATTEAECGNYRDHDLEGAKKYAAVWVDGILQKGWSAFDRTSLL